MNALLGSANRLRRTARGVTLVELLVTVMIFAILAAALLFSMGAAQEASRRSQTQMLIATLHSLLIERYETYVTRRSSYLSANEMSSTGPMAAAVIRLKEVRKMVKMDFPDRWRDVAELTTGSDPVHVDNTSDFYHMAIAERARVLAYLGTKGLTSTEQVANLETNEGAELLYLIITYGGSSDGTNWKKIPDSQVGDTDQDTALEFLDGWGRPISFIRWPAGFVSDLQAGQIGAATTTAIQTAAQKDHDPFDPMRADLNAYRTVPLIISAGSDGLFDVSIISVANTDAVGRWNPYATSGSPLRRAGETFDQNNNGVQDWHDNIHNHLINLR